MFVFFFLLKIVITNTLYFVDAIFFQAFHDTDAVG